LQDAPVVLVHTDSVNELLLNEILVWRYEKGSFTLNVNVFQARGAE